LRICGCLLIFGTVTVDVTSSTMFPDGTVTSIDITFPGLNAFDILVFQGKATSPFKGWFVDARNNASGLLQLDFTTAPTPSTLVGLNSGGIIGNGVFSPSPTFAYDDLSGRMTPVPEPSSLILFTIALLVFGPTVRFGKKVGHPLGA
jgi:hypothetical protein